MLSYPSLAALREAEPAALPGPVAVLLCEDAVEIDSTLAHLVRLGFKTVVAMADPSLPVPLPDPAPKAMLRVAWRNDRPGTVAEAVNTVADRCPGAWVHYCFNAEYLFFPFCETRRVGEMLAFHTEERRDAMLSFVVDLYAADLGATGPVDRDSAHLDASGYYAMGRIDPASGHPVERQLDFYGGLRWRFEEHVPPTRRRIDRISLFRAVPGVRMRDDFTFSEPEYNTYACPWHNNLTAAICSFRAAKALAGNAGSRDHIDGFVWNRSEKFRWNSEQLMDLGLMEPGQWF